MDLLIGDVFRAAAAAVPGRVAVALGDRTYTYGELDRLGSALPLHGRGLAGPHRCGAGQRGLRRRGRALSALAADAPACAAGLEGLTGRAAGPAGGDAVPAF